MMAPSTHETDSYARANEQVRPSRAGRLLEADIETIAEGGESMGRGEKRELTHIGRVVPEQTSGGRRRRTCRNGGSNPACAATVGN